MYTVRKIESKLVLSRKIPRETLRRIVYGLNLYRVHDNVSSIDQFRYILMRYVEFWKNFTWLQGLGE